MKIFLPIIGGAAALFLAMGVARFAFTPVLPIMQAEFGFSDTTSGLLASANYLGYLLGAVYTRFLPDNRKYTMYIASVILSVVFILLMASPIQSLWYLFRFLSGFFSAIVFVLSSEFILEYLEQNNMLQFGGVIYSGIGGGMAFSGLTVPFLSKFVGASMMWLCLGLLSLIPMFIAIYAMPKISIKRSLQSTKPKGIKKEIILLGASYFLEGFAYIITGTFISVIMLRATGSIMLSGYVWVFAGLGAVFITPFWMALHKRISLKNVLIIVFIVQIISISAPLITTNIVVAMLGAVGFGGTFLGIVSLSLAYGRQLSPGGTTTAILTILFSLGQMIGPVVAGFFADKTGNFTISILIATIAAIIGCLLIGMIKYQKGGENASA